MFFGDGKRRAIFWESWNAFNWQAYNYGSIPQITNLLIFTLANRTNGRYASFFGACKRRNLVFSVKFPPSGSGPSSKERRELLRLVLQHRDALYAEWEAKVI